MDDRIQELLERARETAATAGEYAGQMVDTARLRGRLFALRTDINGLLHIRHLNIRKQSVTATCSF